MWIDQIARTGRCHAGFETFAGDSELLKKAAAATEDGNRADAPPAGSEGNRGAAALSGATEKVTVGHTLQIGRNTHHSPDSTVRKYYPVSERNYKIVRSPTAFRFIRQLLENQSCAMCLDFAACVSIRAVVLRTLPGRCDTTAYLNVHIRPSE